MEIENEVQRKEILRWVEDNMDSVPNLDRLRDKMVSEGTDGHYVHAYYVCKLHGCGRYKITDIEATGGGHDIDVQLDGRINIQVWYAMNMHGHALDSWLKSDTTKNMAVARHLEVPTDQGGVPTDQGGVPTDLNYDGERVRGKLAQLPDDMLGILLLHGGEFPYYDPVSSKDIPSNKCTIVVNSQTCRAELRYSPEFSHFEDAEGVADCLGIELVNN